MIAKGPAVPTAAATAILGLVIGGVVGFYGRAAQENPSGTAAGPAARQASQAGGGGGGGGRGGGGGGAPQPNPDRDLSRLVGSLNTIEKVQNKGLTADQKAKLKPILAKIQAAESIPESDAKADLDNINGILNADQKEAITALTPQRGGRGGGGGGGGRGGGAGTPMLFGPVGSPNPTGMTGAPPSGMGGGGGGGRGGQSAPQDPTKPFATDPAKKALTELSGEVSK